MGGGEINCTNLAGKLEKERSEILIHGYKHRGAYLMKIERCNISETQKWNLVVATVFLVYVPYDPKFSERPVWAKSADS